jgi:hypothetical protein
VCYGPHGPGSYQDFEISLAHNKTARQRKEGGGDMPFFPVLLTNTPEMLKPQGFSSIYGWIDLRTLDVDTAVAHVYKTLKGRTLRTPDPAGTRPVADGTTVERRVVEVVRRLKTSGMTFFVGRRHDREGAALPLSSYDMAKRILQKLRDEAATPVDPDNEDLLFLEMLGRYYSAAVGDDLLDAEVRRGFRDGGAAPGEKAPLLYRRLAEIVRVLRDRSPGGRGFQDNSCFIVTTNFDTLLERELLMAGVPFTRLVRTNYGSGMQVNEYATAVRGGNGELVIGGPTDGPRSGASPFQVPAQTHPDHARLLSRAIAETGAEQFPKQRDRDGNPAVPMRDIDLASYTPPYLYKHHGSEDVRFSCVVTSDHHFSLVGSAGSIPDVIGNAIANEASLFVGYSPLDADLRELHFSLLRPRFQLGQGRLRLMVQAPPDRTFDDPCRFKLETLVWDQVRDSIGSTLQIELLESRAEPFLGRVLTEIQR